MPQPTKRTDFIYLFFIMSAYLNVCMCTMGMSDVHGGEGVSSPGTGVTVACDLLCAGIKTGSLARAENSISPALLWPYSVYFFNVK